MKGRGHFLELARTTLVGRHRELEAIEDAVVRAAEGAGGALVISGEAGIGKTRLAEEAATRAEERGFLVLHGSSSPADAGIAYGPIVEALGRHLRELQAPQRAKLVRGLDALGLLFEGLSLPSSPVLGDPGLEKSRLFQAVLVLLERLTATRPVALVLDDLQWVDHASVELLASLLREVEALPALLVMTYRGEDPGESRAARTLLEWLRTKRGLSRELQLGRLHLDDSVALARAVLGDDPSPALTETVVERAGGIPLFVLVLLDDLHESGCLVRREGRWVVTAPHDPAVPPVAQRLVASRLARLAPRERSVLAAVSCGGEGVQHAHLRVALGIEEAVLSPALRGLVSAGLVVERTTGGRVAYQVGHPLVGEVAYGELSAGRRMGLHASFVEALEATSPVDWRAVAFHARRAGEALDPERRLEVLVRAGREALRRYANQDAITHLDAAVEAARECDRRESLPALLEDLGEAWQRVGEEQAARRVWEEALESRLQSGDREAAARLHRRLASAESNLGRFSAASGRIDAGLRTLGDAQGTDERLALLAVGVLNDFRRGHLASARAGAEELSRAAGRLGSSPGLLQAHMLAAGSHLEAADYMAASAEAALALDLARRRNDATAEQQALAFLALADLSLGDLDGLGAHVQANLELTSRRGIVVREYRVHLYRSLGAFYRGRWEEATDVAAGAQMVVDQQDTPRTRVLVSVPVLLDIHRGRLDQAEERLREARRSLVGAGGLRESLSIVLDILSAFSRLEQGRPQETADLVDRLGDGLLLGVLPPWGVMLAAEAQARLGHPALPETLDRLSGMGEARSFPAVWAVRAAGLAADADGRPDRGVALLSQAARGFDALGMPFEAARARLEAAEVLPDAAEAGTVVACHRVFQRLGAQRYVDRGARMLRALGVSAPRAAGRPGGGLTPRQLDVARLVARGLSNAQIADRLFISPRTVTTHLEHIYRKLELTSRVALTRYVVERQLAENGHPDT